MTMIDKESAATGDLVKANALVGDLTNLYGSRGYLVYDLRNTQFTTDNPQLIEYRSLSRRWNQISEAIGINWGLGEVPAIETLEVTQPGVMVAARSTDNLTFRGDNYMVTNDWVLTAHRTPLARHRSYLLKNKDMAKEGEFRPTEAYALFGFGVSADDPDYYGQIRLEATNYLGPGGPIKTFGLVAEDNRSLYIGRPKWTLAQQLVYVRLFGIREQE